MATLTAALVHVTAPASIGAGCDIELPEDASIAEIALAVAAVADAVARKREALGIADPLAPVIVRAWHVTDAGTYLLDSMTEHSVKPQPADVPDAAPCEDCATSGHPDGFCCCDEAGCSHAWHALATSNELADRIVGALLFGRN